MNLLRKLSLSILLLFSIVTYFNAQTISTVAGSGALTFGGDGSLAVTASLSGPTCVATDTFGNIYIADSYNNRIRKISAATGIITTVAGSASGGYGGDGGQATSAFLNSPGGIIIDASGNILIADTYNNRIRKVTTATGIITTIAGTGVGAYGGDGGLATAAKLFYPSGISLDVAGNIYIADQSNHRIRKITIANNIITTVAGTGIAGFSGDGASATLGQLDSPDGVAVDTAGNVYIADYNNMRIRKVNPLGVISTYAGNGGAFNNGDGGPATSATIDAPNGVAVDSAGNVYIASYYNKIRKVTAATSIITTFAGYTIAVGWSGDGGLATNAQFNSPNAIAFDKYGNSYIADWGNQRVRKINTLGIISTICGTGLSGYGGDGASATAAYLNNPTGVAVDVAGNIYIADQENHRVRKIDLSGIITTVAGTGIAGYSGDNGLATAAQLYEPRNITFDRFGNIYIAEWGNKRIRKITVATGIITTVAGTGVSGALGDGGPATSAQLKCMGVAVNKAGDIYIADYTNHKIRKVTAATGIISTFAGTGSPGYTGNGGPATSATMYYPHGIALDTAGNVYVAEWSNYVIRKINVTTGIISTVVGTGVSGFSGDGGLATAAQLASPSGVAVDSFGNIFIADNYNHRIRKVNVSGIISTIAGTGTLGFTGDGALATAATFWNPHGVATDGAGQAFVADWGNHRIRKIDCTSTSPSIVVNPTSITLCEIDSTIFNVSASGGVLSYQWQDSTASHTWANISGAITSSYKVFSTLTMDGNKYHCIALGNCTNATSKTATLNVLPRTDIYGHVTSPVGNITSGNLVLLKYLLYQTHFDTLQVVSPNSSGNYHFTNVNHGTYLLKVFPNTTLYPASMPTYFGDKYLWAAADTIYHDCNVNDTSNISVLFNQSAPGGAGILGGIIREGAGYIRAEGDPIPGLDVKLGKNPSGGIIANMQTNSSGYYSFGGLALNSIGESYTVYVDVPGLGQVSFFTVVLDATHPIYDSLNYRADSTKIYIDTLSNTGISNYSIAKENKFKIYPNPFKGNTSIEYTISSESNVSLEVMNVLGVKIKTLVNSKQSSGNHKYNLNNELSAGVYLIKLMIDAKSSTQIIVVIE